MLDFVSVLLALYVQPV